MIPLHAVPMRLKAPPIEISSKNPFEHDLLNRAESANVLKQFVENLTEPFVLAIDSPWGTGKTTFLKMWVEVLRASGFRCLYFSAWENDFSESPLVSLIGEIGSSLDHAGDKGSQTQFTENFQKVKHFGAALVKTATPSLIKIATAGVLDLKGFGEELGKLAEDIAKKKIEKYEADKNTIHEFRKSLAGLVAKSAESQQSIPSKPVVFIIDELDRCRPDYAIELLEKVKHLFNVDGLVFVLAIDKEQLGHSVQSLYGAGLNSDGYLRRFIDLEYSLPKPKAQLFVQAQFERFGLNTLFSRRTGDTRSDRPTLEEAVAGLFSLFDFPLRTQEQCFTQIAIVVRTTPHNFYLHGTQLGTLICLRARNRDLYFRYAEGHAEPKEVLDYLRSFPGGDKFMNSDLGALIEMYLVAGIRDSEARNRAMLLYQEQAKSQSLDGALRERFRMVAERFRWLPSTTQDLTGYLFKRIEFTHHFIKLDEGV
jgi:hypothetical protein